MAFSDSTGPTYTAITSVCLQGGTAQRYVPRRGSDVDVAAVTARAAIVAISATTTPTAVVSIAALSTAPTRAAAGIKTDTA